MLSAPDRPPAAPLVLCICPPQISADSLIEAVDALAGRLPHAALPPDWCVLLRRPATSLSDFIAFSTAVAPSVVKSGLQLGLNASQFAPGELSAAISSLPVAWLQLPERAASVPAWREAMAAVGLRPTIARSVHDRDGLRRAVDERADAAVLSPLFATTSKPGVAPLGVHRFHDWTEASGLPVWALGGIDAASSGDAIDTGAAGLAAISAAWSDGPQGLHCVSGARWDRLRRRRERANGP